MASRPPLIAVIIPAFNEEKHVLGCLRAVSDALAAAEGKGSPQQTGGGDGGAEKKGSRVIGAELAPRIIVSDGGSTDQTREIARRLGATVVETSETDAKGRGPTLNRGAEKAPSSTELFLFLHVDCIVPKDFFIDLAKFWQENQPQIGFCKMKFTSEWTSLLLFEYLAQFESVFTTFGDQGLVVSRKLYEKMGGFPDQVLLEDVEFLRKARAETKIEALPMVLSVSARKFEKRGALLYMFQCVVILLLYLGCALSPKRLAKLYKNPLFLAPGATLLVLISLSTIVKFLVKKMLAGE